MGPYFKVLPKWHWIK